MSDLQEALKAASNRERRNNPDIAGNTSDKAGRRPISDPTVEARKAPSRRGTDQVTVFLDKRAKKQLQQLKLDEETTIQALMQEAINDLFAKYNIPEIATRK